MTSSQYRLKPIRGPRLKLAPHPESCEIADIRAYAESSEGPFAVDLFCCGGGLSLGLEEAGFKILLGVDHDESAIETHRAHFGGVSLIADLSDQDVVSDIVDALQGVKLSLVAGSPPCQPFSRAGDSKIRSLIQQRARPPEDERRKLWESFLAVVNRLRPPAVLMENVPDIVGGHNSIIFRQIVEALESLEYNTYTGILPCWHFGVPQHRQRLFVVGIKEGVPFRWPKRQFSRAPGVGAAISDLSPVEPGVVNDGLPYSRPSGVPATALQQWARRGQPKGPGGKIYDHFSRPVRPDDLEAFSQMAPHMRYSSLPAHLRRYRSDQFDDKYNRLHKDEPARTITAHIARDGYWYIHPTQHRTLTVREAARIQTFPDRFRFAGTPSHAFRQIGEAVPPLVALAIGKSLIRSLKGRGRSSHTIRTNEISLSLVQWLNQQQELDLRAPWRLGQGLWQILMGMVVFKGLPTTVATANWRIYRDRWPDVAAYLSDENRDSAANLGSSCVAETLESIARALNRTDANMPEGLREVSGLTLDRKEMALALAGLGHNMRLTNPLRRLLGRISGESHPESRFAHQNVLGRLVGVNSSHKAYAAVLELSERLCRPKEPSCESCPLSASCNWYQGNRKRRNRSPIMKARLWE